MVLGYEGPVVVEVGICNQQDFNPAPVVIRLHRGVAGTEVSSVVLANPPTSVLRFAMLALIKA